MQVSRIPHRRTPFSELLVIFPPEQPRRSVAFKRKALDRGLDQRVLLAALICLVALAPFETSTAHPVNIGHRGGTVDAPENTIVNFDISLQNGTDWLETDIWLSADGVPVIHHDETLDRTTDGSGYVWSKTLAELKQLDAGSWYGPGYVGTRIPTLEEALTAVQGRGKFLIEIKRVQYIPAVAQVVDSVGFPHQDLITWIRLGPGMAELYKQAIPNSRVILAASRVFGRQEQDIWQRATAGDHGLIMDYLDVDQQWIDLVHSYGLSTYAAVVVSPYFDQMIGLGLDGIVVSNPRLLETRLPGPTPECQDGIDNDGDGLVDAPADPGCFGPEDVAELSPCSDGIDNDGDGLVDHPDDPGCFSPFYPFENPQCDDGIDNDGDGVTDHPGAAGCFARFDQIEATACGDGLDNDSDGLIDYPFDPGCSLPTDVSERGDGLPCDNGADDDADGFADYPDDPGCTGASDPSERQSTLVCDNGIDDDDDDLIDFGHDPGCASPTDANERGASFACDNGIDDDLDGIADYPEDDGCSGPTDVDETDAEMTCDNGVDDDGDGEIDYPDDPGCFGPGDSSERGSAFQCDNGLDDDGDGLIDFPADDGCLHPSNPVEAPEPDPVMSFFAGVAALAGLNGSRRRPTSYMGA